MGVFYETIPANIADWILQQHMFWISTAPLSAAGHVNLSPKGGEYFGLLDERTFWYHDLTGSGTETIAHVRENGRVTVMFTAFEGAPRIVRLFGHGRILERESAVFDDFVAKHQVQVIPATRSIILVDVHQVGSSCGYSVPFYEFKTHRKTLNQVFEKKKANLESGKSDETMDRYWAYKNAWSIDGLPGMKRGVECGAKENVAPIEKMIGSWAPVTPYGPKSSKYSNRVRYYLATLDKTRVDLKSVVMMMVVAFVFGVVLTTYGPLLMDQQRSRLGRLLL